MQAPARQPRGRGGVFGPLAQYPCSSYAAILKTEEPGTPLTGSLPLQAPASLSKVSGTRCMSTMRVSHPYTTALLLVDADSNAAVDRRALREVGITQVRVMTSGLQAARMLAGYLSGEETFHADVLVCQQRLADMQGTHFAALLRKHPRLLGLPILAVVGNVNEAEKIKALASGFSGLLARPYSPERLNFTLYTLSIGTEEQGMYKGRQMLDTEAFDAALRQYEQNLQSTGTPDMAFRAGLEHLQARRWEEAIQSFQRALHQLSLKGESELGLAAAWRGKGDLKKYCYYLNEAGHTFARATLWHKARVAYARLLLTEPDAPSPFLATAESLIRAQQYEEAAEALAQGYEELPEEVPQRLAQACIFTDNPEYSAHKVQHALEQTALEHCAEELGGHIRAALAEQTRQAQVRREAMARWQAEMQAREEAATSVIAPLEGFGGQGMGIELAEESPRPTSWVETVGAPEYQENSPASYQREDARESLAAAAPAGDSAADATALPGAPSRNAARPAPRGTELAPLPVLDPFNPLSEEEAKSGLFASFPGINEALTVAKVTWKLLKK